MRRRIPFGLILQIILAITLVNMVYSMPPTDEAIRQWIADGVYEQKIANWNTFKETGGCAPFEHSPLKTFRDSPRSALGTDAVDTLRVICIMVEFSDWPASGQSIFATPDDFDSLLFSDRDQDAIFNVTGSMTDYYLETSYGTLYILGDIFGWYMMPNTYASYVGSNDGLGGGGRLLAGHAVDAAEAAGVDFSPYANGDFWVDGVIVIHAGAGAETGVYGIWSHRSSMSQRTYDGVGISAYTMNPEEYAGGISSMGVYGHEYGHALGLPDLYDINDSSPGAGLGRWSMMAGGSWNNGGRTPAHFDAWCKLQLGFVDVVWPDSNLKQVEFPMVEHNPVVYGLLENPGGNSIEYWLVENRQRVGFDAALPGDGLCIFHVDDAVGSQSNRLRYKVAMEQADGDNDLAENGGSDFGDPWPGQTNNRDFHDQSEPNSRDNDGGITEVGVWAISNSDSLMYADLDVFFSHSWIELTSTDSLEFSDVAPGGDGDGVPEAGETIEFYCRVINRMLTAYDPVITLSVDNGDIQFLQNGITLDSDLNTNSQVGNTTPIKFSIPADFQSGIFRFTLSVVADSASGSGDGLFGAVFEFDDVLGAPQVLVLDDDGGDAWEQKYLSTLLDLRVPTDDWDKGSIGSPSGSDLSEYKTVIWHTGINIGGGGTLTTDDIVALKQFLDGGGNLLLSSLTSASDLHTLDSAFMADYLHATLAGTNIFGLGFIAEEGSEVFDGQWFTYDGNAPINPMHDLLSPVGSAEEALYLSDDFGNGNFGSCGISYTGEHRTIFVTFPVEFVNDGSVNRGFAPKDTLIARAMKFFNTSYPYVSEVFVEGDEIQKLVNHTPVFGWNAWDTGSTAQAQFEIEVGTDDDWSAAEMWEPGTISSADTFITHAGSVLEDGQTYFLRVRVNSGADWSEWFGAMFHMNSLPTAPTPVSPSGGQFTDLSPSLVLLNGTDVESESLFCQFEVYDDEGLTSLVATSSNIVQGTDSTSWAVDVSLGDFTQHWWRGRTYDGAEYSDWSSAVTFNVNSAYEPPTGSLYFPSRSFAPCDTTCESQPIVVQVSKPLSKAVIPIRIPDNVEVCDVTFDGLLTEAWDLNTVTIEAASGYLVVTLENSVDDLLPPDTATVFNILFQAPVQCTASYYLSWDTAQYSIPSEQLKFTDTMEVFGPDFDISQDSTEIIGYNPGDMDDNPGVDLGDLTALIDYLFISFTPPCNLATADVNEDCSGPDLGDLTFLIGYLFIDGPPPQCACESPGLAASSKQRPDILVETVFDDGYTSVVLHSAVELSGVQLELVGHQTSTPENLQTGRLDLLAGQVGDVLRVGVLDLDGSEIIPSGSLQLLRIEGEVEVVSAIASDLNYSVWTPSLSSSGFDAAVPETYSLEQNYPNPFNPTTRISFALPEAAHVRLDVFNILGQQVVTMIEGWLDAGYHSVEWDGLISGGTTAASGVYFYRLETKDFSQTRKMILLK